MADAAVAEDQTVHLGSGNHKGNKMTTWFLECEKRFKDYKELIDAKQADKTKAIDVLAREIVDRHIESGGTFIEMNPETNQWESLDLKDDKGNMKTVILKTKQRLRDINKKGTNNACKRPRTGSESALPAGDMAGNAHIIEHGLVEIPIEDMHGDHLSRDMTTGQIWVAPVDLLDSDDIRTQLRQMQEELIQVRGRLTELERHVERRGYPYGDDGKFIGQNGDDEMEPSNRTAHI